MIGKGLGALGGCLVLKSSPLCMTCGESLVNCSLCLRFRLKGLLRGKWVESASGESLGEATW